MATLGRVILSLTPIFMAIGAFKEDFNETHIFNTNWPGHAKFHNGQTMSMSVVLGALSLWFIWRTSSLGSKKAQQESIFTAALIGSAYGLTGIAAYFYPGSLSRDPEFGPDTFVQKWIFGGSIAVHWIGYLVEMNRLDGLKDKGT